jgi:hypothetical protein
MKRHVLAKMTPFHTLLKKESPKRCCFERHCSISSSHCLLFPRGPKKTLKKHPTCLNTDRWPTTNAKKQRGQTPRRRWGNCTKATTTALPCPLTRQRQAISPPFSTYNYRGREEAKKEGKRMGKKQKRRTRKEEE